MTEISRAAQVAKLANEVVSVKDFGAVGDGVTDDYAAIQAALDYWVTKSYTEPAELLIPAGDYIVGSQLNAIWSSHTSHVKTLNCYGTLNGNNELTGAEAVALAAGEDVIRFSVEDVWASYYVFNGLSAKNCGAGGSCMTFDGGSGNTNQALYVVHLNEPSAQTGKNISGSGGHGISFINGFFEAAIMNPRVGLISDTCYGLRFKPNETASQITSSIDIVNPNIRGGKHGIYLEGIDHDVDIIGGTVILAQEEGIMVEAANVISLSGIHVENNGLLATDMTSSNYAGIRVSGTSIDINNIRYANSSDSQYGKMKHAVKVFATSRGTIRNIEGYDGTGLLKKASLSSGVNGQFSVADDTPSLYEIAYGTPVYFDLPSQRLVGTNIGDNDVTLDTTDPFSQRYASTLTANRTVTLPTTEWNGLRFQICRTAATAGAFTLDIGGLYTIPADTNGTVTVMGTGSGWRLESVSLW